MDRFCSYFKTQNKICSVFSIDFFPFPWSSWKCYVLIFIWTCRYMISFLQTVTQSKVSAVFRLAGALSEHLNQFSLWLTTWRELQAKLGKKLQNTSSSRLIYHSSTYQLQQDSLHKYFWGAWWVFSWERERVSSVVTNTFFWGSPMQITRSHCSFQVFSKLDVGPGFWVFHTQNNMFSFS